MTIDEEVETWTGGVSDIPALRGAPFFAYPNPASRADLLRFSGRVPDRLIVRDGAGRIVAEWTAVDIAGGMVIEGLTPGVHTCSDASGGARTLLIIHP